MSQENTEVLPTVEDSNPENDTTESADDSAIATQEPTDTKSSEVPSTQELSAQLEKALQGNADPRQAQKPTADAKTEAKGKDGKANQKPESDPNDSLPGDPKQWTVKADRKEHAFSSRKELLDAASWGIHAKNQLSRWKQDLDQQSAAYKRLNDATRAEPAVGTVANALSRYPELAPLALDYLKQVIASGEVNPDRIELNRLKREQSSRETDERSYQEGQTLKQEHLTWIQGRQGEAVTDDQYERLAQWCLEQWEASGKKHCPTLKDAYIETGEYERHVKEKAQREWAGKQSAKAQAIRKAQGVQGSGSIQQRSTKTSAELAAQLQQIVSR